VRQWKHKLGALRLVQTKVPRPLKSSESVTDVIVTWKRATNSAVASAVVSAISLGLFVVHDLVDRDLPQELIRTPFGSVEATGKARRNLKSSR
jgi:hypothetical protein